MYIYFLVALRRSYAIRHFLKRYHEENKLRELANQCHNKVDQLFQSTSSTALYLSIIVFEVHMYCRTQNVSGHFNLANYSESILSLTFQTLTIMCNTVLC